MCTQRPCKCSVDCYQVADIDQMWKGGGQPGTKPGAFHFGTVRDGEVSYAQLWISLPCEGGELHGLPIIPPGQAAPAGIRRPFWQWDGNRERPTLSPSILTWRTKDPNKPDEGANRQEVWHGHLKAGRLVSC